MELDIFDSSLPCRVCLETGASIPIFEPKNSCDPDVYSKLCECIGGKIEDVDGHPRHLCTLCHITLNTAFKFIKQFKKSTDILSECQLRVKEEAIEFSELDDTGYNDDNTFLIHFANVSNIEPKLEQIDNEKVSRKSNKKPRSNKIQSKIAKAKSESKDVKQKITKEESKLKESKKDKAETCKERLCDVCGKIFGNADRLYYHRSHSHRLELNPEKKVKCPQCPKVISSRKLKFHIQRMHSTDMERKHICSACGRRFMYLTDMRNHYRTHSDDKRAEACTLCDKAFVCKKSLQVHMRSNHTGERPEVCSVCDKSFFDADYLKEHMRLHTGERPFKCPVCDKGFAQRGNMKSHIRHNHRVSQLDPVTIEALSKCRADYIRLMRP